MITSTVCLLKHVIIIISLTQEKIEEPLKNDCSVASLLDRDLSNCNRQPTIPSSFTEFETYTQQKSQVPTQISAAADTPVFSESFLTDRETENNPSDCKSDKSDQMQNSDISIPLNESPSNEEEKLIKTPIYDLSRPITGQCLRQRNNTNISDKLCDLRISGQVPMEIPCKTPTQQGDFTLLGMEFESVPQGLLSGSRKRHKVPSDLDSSSNSPQITQKGDRNENDFKFGESNENFGNPSDSFGASQLEIPFSQLDGRYDSGKFPSQPDSNMSQENNSYHRLESPSNQSLRARGYRAKTKISVSAGLNYFSLYSY